MSFIAGSAPGPTWFCPWSWGLNLDGFADCRGVAGAITRYRRSGFAELSTICRSARGMTMAERPDWS